MKKNLLFLWMLILGGSGAAMGQFSNPFPLLEEYTGTWCQYCADGAVRVEQVLANNQSVHAIAIHSGDVMEIPDGAAVDAFYNPAYPEGMINRDGALYSRNQWAGICNTASQGATSASVSLDSVSWDPNTREITARIRVQFTGLESGDMRFNVAVTENNVTGGAQYSQYNADNNTPGHPYQGAGNPISGFAHQHVLRAYLGGAWGTFGVISNSVGFGEVFTHTYTYTLPTSFDENEIHLVAMVQRYGATAQDRGIINSDESALPGIVGVEGPLTSDLDLMHIAPNPTNDFSRITYTLNTDGMIRMEVLDIEGKQIAVLADGHQTSGVHTLFWNGADMQGNPVANGIYLVRLVSQHGESKTQRVMMAR